MTQTDQAGPGHIQHADSNRRDADPRRAARIELTHRLLAQAAEAEPAERERLLDEVVLANRCVAEAVASRYRNRGADEEDLRQVAYEGLVQAVSRYDADRADDLLTYAVPVIRGGVQRHFRDRCWDVRPPRRIQVLQGQLNRTIDRLRSELGREPTRNEICLELDITADELNDAEAAFGSFNAGSLDREVGGGAGLTLADVLADDDGDPQAAEARVILAPVVRRLSERDRRILYLRFFEDRTQQEIGEEIGVTQMQVSRLLSRITTSLRRSLGEPAP
jgi:RNA polymerase sigma-B factor